MKAAEVKAKPKEEQVEEVAGGVDAGFAEGFDAFDDY